MQDMWVFLKPFNVFGRQVDNQSDLDRIYINPGHTTKSHSETKTLIEEGYIKPGARLTAEDSTDLLRISNKRAGVSHKKLGKQSDEEHAQGDK